VVEHVIQIDNHTNCRIRLFALCLPCTHTCMCSHTHTHGARTNTFNFITRSCHIFIIEGSCVKFKHGCVVFRGNLLIESLDLCFDTGVIYSCRWPWWRGFKFEVSKNAHNLCGVQKLAACEELMVHTLDSRWHLRLNSTTVHVVCWVF
jgi:hypothetical protein